jgi:DNA-binding CsgD family transcriptional regulator
LITTRERQVLDLMGAGLTARRIANELGISERTVNAHVGKIYRRMGVNNRVDALREAMRAGIVRI